MYFVYIIECADGSLYTGISTDPKRRFEEHRNSSKGAKYTRSHEAVRIVYTEEAEDRSAASKREYEIKRLSRDGKLKLISSQTAQKY